MSPLLLAVELVCNETVVLEVEKPLTYEYTAYDDQCSRLTIVTRPGYRIRAVYDASENNVFRVSVQSSIII